MAMVAFVSEILLGKTRKEKKREGWLYIDIRLIALNDGWMDDSQDMPYPILRLSDNIALNIHWSEMFDSRLKSHSHRHFDTI